MVGDICTNHLVFNSKKRSSVIHSKTIHSQIKNDTLGRKLQLLIVSKFEEPVEASNILYKLLR